MCADDLSIRHRVFVLSFVLVAGLITAVEVTIGIRDEHWRWLVTFSVVMPLTCFTKSVIGKASKRLNGPSGHCPAVERRLWLRVEEGALLAFLAIYLIRGVTARGHVFGDAVAFYCQAIVAIWGLEVASLLWKFACCRVCCPCCVPPRDDVHSLGEVVAGLPDAESASERHANAV